MSKSSQMSKYLISDKKTIKELYWDPYYTINHRHITLGENIFELLWQYYSSSNRYYHNINHIVSCHQQLDLYEESVKSPKFMRFGIWFHDIIYDTRQNNNEEMSILLAKALLFDVCDIVENKYIEDIILITKYNKIPKDDYERLMSDIDLSILGTFNFEYKKYSESIRLEYGWVPDYMYYTNRLKILESFLDMEKIYYTEYFHALYNDSAKYNLVNEIKEIRKILE